MYKSQSKTTGDATDKWTTRCPPRPAAWWATASRAILDRGCLTFLNTFNEMCLTRRCMKFVSRFSWSSRRYKTKHYYTTTLENVKDAQILPRGLPRG